MKEIIDKLDFIQIKNFYCEKDTVKRKRKQDTDCEETFVKHI